MARRSLDASANVRAPGPKLNAADMAELECLMARTEAKIAALG